MFPGTAVPARVPLPHIAMYSKALSRRKGPAKFGRHLAVTRKEAPRQMPRGLSLVAAPGLVPGKNPRQHSRHRELSRNGSSDGQVFSQPSRIWQSACCHGIRNSELNPLLPSPDQSRQHTQDKFFDAENYYI